jgi:hypothetical protein
MLTCAHAGDKDYVCSGWGERSDWVQNILKDPLVTVQVGREEYCAQAYRVEDLNEFSAVTEEMFHTGGDSHFKPWLESYGIKYNKEDMIRKRDRLQIFGFRPVEKTGPKPLPADLRWIWLLLIGLLIVIWGILAML